MGHFFKGIPAIPEISCRIAKQTFLQREKPACLELFGLTNADAPDGLDGRTKRKKSPGKKPPVFASGGPISGACDRLDGQENWEGVPGSRVSRRRT
jgi:hypothetical protein